MGIEQPSLFWVMTGIFQLYINLYCLVILLLQISMSFFGGWLMNDLVCPHSHRRGGKLIPRVASCECGKQLIDHKSQTYSVRRFVMRLYYTTDEKRSPIKHQRQYVFNGNETIWRDRVIAEHKPATTAVNFHYRIQKTCLYSWRSPEV